MYEYLNVRMYVCTVCAVCFTVCMLVRVYLLCVFVRSDVLEVFLLVWMYVFYVFI